MRGSGKPVRRTSQQEAIGPTQTSLMITLSKQWARKAGETRLGGRSGEFFRW